MKAFIRLSITWIKEAAKRKSAPPVHYSISVVDSLSVHRPNFFELLFSQDELHSFLRQAAARIEPNDPSAAKVLRAYP